MKKSFIVIPVAAIMLSACSGNLPKEHDHNDGTHQHDDGSVHQNHEDTSAKQEEFTVPADTLKTDSAHGHSNDGHEHPHKH